MLSNLFSKFSLEINFHESCSQYASISHEALFLIIIYKHVNDLLSLISIWRQAGGLNRDNFLDPNGNDSESLTPKN